MAFARPRVISAMTLLLAAAVLPTLGTAPSASATGDYWEIARARQADRPVSAQARVTPERYTAVRLDRGALAAQLARAPREQAGRPGASLSVPAPDGTMMDFTIAETAVMEPGLAAQHPELKTYTGRGTSDPSTTIRLDLTPMGFHAAVRSGPSQDAWYVDPAYNGDDVNYLSYYGSDLPEPQQALIEPELETGALQSIAAQAGELPGAEISVRTYRLALVTDPSYADYFGSENVMAEKVTLINRVNQIYNDDLAIRMILVEATESLNLDSPQLATSPGGPCGDAACFTPDQLAECSNSTTARNRIVLGQLIGAGNYDIGHIALGNPGGGVAGVGVVGGDGKGRGCTGLPTPEGDYFAIDYVAHEMGHQFGAWHTYNGTQYAECAANRDGVSAVEPGSGSSVMAYAGICQQDNTQPHSDPYFSQRSISDMTSYLNAAKPAINEVQTVSLRDFTGYEAFTLSWQGQTTAPIKLGTNYSLAGIKSALEAITGPYTVTVAGFGGGSFDVTGFQVTFSGGGLNGVDVAPLTLNPTGYFNGFVGETARGGPIQNSGYSSAPTGNLAPVVSVPPSRSIPIRTPFALTGSATDPNGDQLYYLWEQNDRGGSGTALGNQVKVDGPLFRVFGSSAQVTPDGSLQIKSPGQNQITSNTTRVFPDLTQIAANNTNARTGVCPDMPPPPEGGDETNVPWDIVDCFSEFLPTADYVGSTLAGNSQPSLNFRLTARDLAPAGGGTAYGDVRLTLDKTAGPFLVSSKNVLGSSVVGGRSEVVTWSVAGTDKPTLASNVRISFSPDGGQTFPIVLVETTPNDGSATVTWPDLDTTQGRIKIEAVGNYFFDMSDADLTVIPGLTVSGLTTTGATALLGQTLEPRVRFVSATKAADGSTIRASATGLPVGFSISRSAFSAAGLRPGTAAWEVTGASPGPAGSYPVTVTLTDGANNSTTVDFTLYLLPDGGTTTDPGSGTSDSPDTDAGGIPPPDSSAPETRFATGPADGAILRKRRARFGPVSTEAPSTFVCTLDGRPVSCSNRFVVRRLAAGTHRVTAAARDSAGNVDPTPVTRTFTVPVDEGKLSRVGKWTRVREARAFGRDYSVAKRPGATLKHRVTGATRLVLLVSKTKNGGLAKVFLGKSLLKKVRTGGATRHGVLEVVVTFPAPRSGVVRIVASGRRPVRIEGLAVVTG